MRDYAGIVAFVVIWFGIAAAMLYNLIETAAFFTLKSWAYARGPVVLRASLPAAAPARADGTRVTAAGRYRFVGPGVALFCFGRGWLSPHLRTLLPVKGVITWSAGRAEIVGRASEAGMILIALLAAEAGLGWSLLVLGPHGIRGLWWILPAALAFIVLIGPVWLSVERRRALQVAREILAVTAGGGARGVPPAGR